MNIKEFIICNLYLFILGGFSIIYSLLKGQFALAILCGIFITIILVVSYFLNRDLYTNNDKQRKDDFRKWTRGK